MSSGSVMVGSVVVGSVVVGDIMEQFRDELYYIIEYISET